MLASLTSVFGMGTGAPYRRCSGCMTVSSSGLNCRQPPKTVPRTVLAPSRNHQIYKKHLKLAVIYSPPEGVPSMLASLTSVFGMGTGVPSLRDHQL